MVFNVIKMQKNASGHNNVHHKDEQADVTAPILIHLEGACFGFYPYGLIIF